MNIGKKSTLIIVGLVVLAIIGLLVAGWGYNEQTQYTVLQYPTGGVEVINDGGYYLKYGGKPFPRNRYTDNYYSAQKDEGGPEDKAIYVTFQGAGKGKISCFIQAMMPTDKPTQLILNQRAITDDSLKMLIRAHLSNCLINTAPIMTASEHQNSRKGEFKQLVEAQLNEGEYQTKRVTVTMTEEAFGIRPEDMEEQNAGTKAAKAEKDAGIIAAGGKVEKTITTQVTKFVEDENGNPVIKTISPLKSLGISISQFSITKIEYDPKTEALFAAKKESLLKAEKFKAEKMEEVLQRLMIVERGLKEKAEVTATANKERATAIIKAEKEEEMATIAARQKVLVEEQSKLEAVTRLAKELAIETQEKLIAETKANKELEVAKINKKAAIENAEAITILAKAEEEKILKAGAITEKERVLAEINAKARVGVAEALKDVQSPANLFITNGSGSAGGSGSGLQGNLMSLVLMRASGVLKDTPEVPAKVTAPVKKTK